MRHWLDDPCQLVNGTSLRVWSRFHVLYTTLFVNTLRNNWFVKPSLVLYLEMYLSLCSFFEKYVLTCTYIIVIGNCHSRTSCTWQCLISSQVLYGCTLNTDFLLDNRHWYAVALRCKRNFVAFQCFQFHGLLQKLLIVVFLISLFLKARLRLAS